MGWLWHRRLANVGIKNLHKLLKGEHILGLTNVHFEKERICNVCQIGKQVGVHHPHKNIMTTDRPLELLHMDNIIYFRHDIDFFTNILNKIDRLNWIKKSNKL
jgi:hypothetical protein